MSNNTLPPPLQRLLDSFNSQLDDSLIVAIAGDYDLSTESGYDEACSTLQSLAESAAIEEASSFDPSGVYRYTEHGDRNEIEDPISTANITTSSADISKSDVFERDILQLQDLFPRIDRLDIRHVLTNENGVVAAALDSLLNLEYLQSTSHPTASPDRFPSADDSRVQPTGGGARYDKRGMAYDISVSNSSEMKMPAAVTYIAERLNMSTDQVSIIYAECGSSRVATVIGILDQHLLQGNGEPLTNIEEKALSDLQQKYRNVPESYLQVIIRITEPMSTHSTELASLINAYYNKRSMNQKLELGYRLTPLPHEDIEGLTRAGVDTLEEAKGFHRKSTPVAKTDADLTRALKASNALHKQKQEAMASAASLYRRGASKPLYRQAAGYYAQQAREHAKRAQDATSAAADIHVDQQSTATTVDLHGVSVLDGVRIARQRAVDWWQTRRESQYESREERSLERSLTIITGLGHHSAGGVSPLRKAVAAALTRDGWKFRIETGKFIVTGR
ncbi:hypothetical protein V8C35DRAFT_325472 [Trichoderma chlorosporum]